MEKKMGRPLADIDKKKFEKLCGLQCTLLEIADFFGVNKDTINAFCKREYDGKTFSEVFAQKRATGRISLRRSQFKLAEKNATMAIWLGKQYLDQKDRIEVDETFKISEEDIKSIEAMMDEE